MEMNFIRRYTHTGISSKDKEDGDRDGDIGVESLLDAERNS